MKSAQQWQRQHKADKPRQNETRWIGRANGGESVGQGPGDRYRWIGERRGRREPVCAGDVGLL
jgi:hypothetical protein